MVMYRLSSKAGHTRDHHCPLWWSIALTAAFPAVLNASEHRLDTVVVTGTRTERTLADTPVRTQVVTRDEIERRHAHDLREAINLVPGIYLRESHGKEGQEVWIQGLDSDRVLILIDGEPVTPSTGSTVDLTQISTADIERIEVVKGASSALYGSSAMGGVINVITRRPEPGFSYQIQTQAGRYGDKGIGSAPHTHQASANLNSRSERVSLRLTLDRRHDEGYYLLPTGVDQHGHTITQTNASARFGLQLSPRWEFFLSPSYLLEEKSQLQSSPGVSALFEKRETLDTLRVLGGTRWQSNGGSGLLLQIGAEQFDNQVENDSLSTPQLESRREARIQSTSFDGQWDSPLYDRHWLSMGLRLFQEQLRQLHTRTDSQGNKSVARELGDDAERRSVELFLQDAIGFDRLELVPGIRFQSDSDFGQFLAPKLNLLYSLGWPTSSQLRASVGRGYRVPNLKERFYFFDQSRYGYMVQGNPDLEPEQSTSLQLGIEFPGRDYRADINLFHNDIKDLIVTAYDPDASATAAWTVYRYANVARARTRGIEAAGEARLGNWRLMTGYTYLEAIDRDTGERLAHRPRHQLKGEIEFGWGQTRIALATVHQSRELADADTGVFSPAWTRWDLRVTHALGRKLEVFAGADNLLDEHRDPRDPSDLTPKPGRHVYAGLRYRSHAPRRPKLPRRCR